MIRRMLAACLFCLCLAGNVAAQGCAVPNTLANGTNADATQVMANFNALLGCINSAVSPPQGRLTLQTGVPVMTTTQKTKTVMIYTPYVGNRIPIYDGTNMLPTTFTELSIAISDTTKNPSPIGSDKINDWFVWNDSGTIRLSHGPDWASNVLRSAALAMVNGTLLNSVAITNGPAASRGTYVGTTRSSGLAQLEWILGASGEAAALHVWNAYNRVQVSTTVNDPNASWLYSLRTIRQANNSNVNQVSFVSGLAEEGITASYFNVYNLPGATPAYADIGLGLDTTVAFDRFAEPNRLNVGSTQTQAGVVSNNYGPQLGYHFLSANEEGDGTYTTTFLGSKSQSLNFTTRM